jgi:tRNA1Val (adenine37-N6)-methyltransferase
MANDYFSFKQFTINQDKCVFKVGTDGVLLGACAEAEGKKRILDIGTGTGLIALMLAQRCEAEIIAIEPDYDSFTQALGNVKLSKWSERIKVINCSLQEYVPDNQRFDLIVSNPPYFINSLRNPDPLKSFARHNDGLSYSDILKGAGRLIQENGVLQLILPYAEGNIFIAEAQEYEFYCNTIIKVRPMQTHSIRRLILGFGKNKGKVNEKFLTIEKGKRHVFTEEYISLTKEFYLKF